MSPRIICRWLNLIFDRSPGPFAFYIRFIFNSLYVYHGMDCFLKWNIPRPCSLNSHLYFVNISFMFMLLIIEHFFLLSIESSSFICIIFLFCLFMDIILNFVQCRKFVDLCRYLTVEKKEKMYFVHVWQNFQSEKLHNDIIHYLHENM